LKWVSQNVQSVGSVHAGERTEICWVHAAGHTSLSRPRTFSENVDKRVAVLAFPDSSLGNTMHSVSQRKSKANESTSCQIRVLRDPAFD
jgi:hypothetical protein